jgi:hypothetical protein
MLNMQWRLLLPLLHIALKHYCHEREMNVQSA